MAQRIAATRRAVTHDNAIESKVGRESCVQSVKRGKEGHDGLPKPLENLLLRSGYLTPIRLSAGDRFTIDPFNPTVSGQ